MFIGGAIPFLIGALTMKSVGKGGAPGAFFFLPMGGFFFQGETDKQASVPVRFPASWMGTGDPDSARVCLRRDKAPRPLSQEEGAFAGVEPSSRPL